MAYSVKWASFLVMKWTRRRVSWTRVRKQPEDEWTNDARSVSGREAAGGSEGNKCEPGDQRQVMREKPELARIFCAVLWQALERGGA